MTDKNFALVKCINNEWGILDKSLNNLDQLFITSTNKNKMNYLVNLLNRLYDENENLQDENKKLNKEIEQSYEENTLFLYEIIHMKSKGVPNTDKFREYMRKECSRLREEYDLFKKEGELND